jgi:prepilin-type N-terminal cleavage/methylation domain-containing protein
MTNQQRRSLVQLKHLPQAGFTLLEVMIALTITAMVLGGLFSLAAGSKQLAVRTQSALAASTQFRAGINFALLDNQFRGIDAVLSTEQIIIRADDLLQDPIRRTAPMNDLLQIFRTTDSDTGEQISGVRWVRSDLPR